MLQILSLGNLRMVWVTAILLSAFFNGFIKGSYAQGGPDDTIPFTTTPIGSILLVVRFPDVKGKPQDATFVFDSGSGGCKISASLTKKLGLTPKMMTFSGGVQDLQVLVPEVKLGTFRVVNSYFGVVSDQVIKNTSDAVGSPIDGIIGASFLLTVPIVIDFQYKVIGLFFHDPVTGYDLKAIGMQNVFAVPLHEMPDLPDVYACYVLLSNQSRTDEESLAVDFGSNVTSLSSSAAASLGLDKHAKRSSVLIMNGKCATFLSTVPLLTIKCNSFPSNVSATISNGGLVIQGLTVYYPKDKLPSYVPPALGLDVLSQYRVLLDYGAKTMYLLPYSSVTPSGTASLSSTSLPSPTNKETGAPLKNEP